MPHLPCAILMVKRPEPGQVKTRLTEVPSSGTRDGADPCSRAPVDVLGAFTAEQACEIARAMLECVHGRLCSLFRERLVLAVTPDDAGGLGLPHPGHVVPQGQGPLGRRMDTAWQYAVHHLGGGSDVPVAFFGIDSPDVPFDVLLRLEMTLRGESARASTGHDVERHGRESKVVRPEVWVGPTHDGGYWTLASRTYRPDLLDGIDWGGRDVCGQTIARAESADLCVERLRTWYDVDRPADVSALRVRLDGSHEPMLRELAKRLDQIGITPA